MAKVKLLFFNSKIQKIIEIFVVLAAFTFIFNRLFSNFETFQSVSFLTSWNNKKTLILFSCLFLMFINWTIESVKWKQLLNNIEKISILTSLKSVLIGITFAIFTPYRIGEFVGRPLLIKKENKLSAILATFVGSVSQSITTIGMGLIGLIIIEQTSTPIDLLNVNKSSVKISLLIIIYLCIVYLFIKPSIIIKIIRKFGQFNNWKNKIDFLVQYKFKELIIVLIYSHLRYIVFFFQYYMLLYIFDVHIGLVPSFAAISLSYLFLFSIPGIPIAEIGIRGSLALYFLGKYSPNEISILAASTSLWIINLAVPAMIGSVFLMISKNKEKNQI